jgi:FkbM family methyltransferase
MMNSKVFIRRQVFMKMWENHPKIWKLLIDMGILFKYKTLKFDKLPKHVTFPSSTMIFVDASENRGRALLLNGGITQKRLRYFWDKAVQVVSPNLVIDVGVNYGECIFSTIYPSHSKILGIEANHYLMDYINMSKESHPNKEQIRIINALASDKNNENRDFYIDRHWSGTSSASYMPSHNMIEKVPVSAVTIDSLVQKNILGQTILFKIDVEGYEAFVLKGMKQLLTICHSAIGFIEFNSDYISQSGISTEEFFAFLQEHFTIYIYLEDDTLLQANDIDFTKLLDIFGADYIHTDIILIAGKEVMDINEHFNIQIT